MVAKIKEKKFAVKNFQYVVRKNDQGLAIREVIELGKNLVWADAKKLQRENKHSWIIPWAPQEKKKKKEKENA